MKTIWKFDLEVLDVQNVRIPEDSEILCIQTQNEIPCLWVLVDDSKRLFERIFETVGTGCNMSNADKKYIGTYQLNNGGLVFHCFEVL